MNYADCKHDQEWTGGPAGYTPIEWRCSGCGVKMTAGEMILWEKFAKLLRDLKPSPTAAQDGEKNA